MEKSKRETPLAIPFNDGFICPKCLGVCVGAKWKNMLRFCPRCGQRLQLMDFDEWAKLKDRVKKMDGAIESGEIVEFIRYDHGLDIAGVYIEALEDLKRREE